MRIRSLWLGHISKYGPRPSKLESNTNLRPTAVGRYWAPIFQDIGLYLPIPPLQTHGISPLLFSKLEAYSVLQYMYLWMHVAWNT